MIPEIIDSAMESFGKDLHITGLIVIAVLLAIGVKKAFFSKNDQFGRESQFEKGWTIEYGNTRVAAAKLREGHADSYVKIVRYAEDHDLAFADESMLNAMLISRRLYRGWRYVAFAGDCALVIDTTVNDPVIRRVHSADVCIYDLHLRLLLIDTRTAPSKDRRTTPVDALPA
ncbi:MAG TPA: hypothetical protein VGE35_04190 [Candidatus Paceibacterota bacterium]